MSSPQTPTSSRAQAQQAPYAADFFPFERHSEEGQKSPSTTTTQRSLHFNDRLSSQHPSNSYLNSLGVGRAPDSTDTSSGAITREGPSLPVGNRAYGNQRFQTRTNSPAGLTSAYEKTPSRSFVYRGFNRPHDHAQYSSQGVRDETAELASIAATGFSSSLPRHSSVAGLDASTMLGASLDGAPRSHSEPRRDSNAIQEESEPVSPDEERASPVIGRAASTLTNIIHTPPSPPSEDLEAEQYNHNTEVNQATESNTPTIHVIRSKSSSETTTLLKKPSHSAHLYGTLEDLEGQMPSNSRFFSALGYGRDHGRAFLRTMRNPKSWNAQEIYRKGVVLPASLLPAVFLGLLLNILDALSYGMILFPLGQPVFSDLGADGISMFYVSTIVSQLVFSCGGSIFKGGIGSEMIEVVPFFHKMAFTILHHVGEEEPKSVLATTILSFAISSILTGMVFFLMGACRVGALIGFFPRHILIGCIGGVGWFLVATGIEVSARLDGNLEYNLTTIRALFQVDTLFLWTTPLVLAIILLLVKRFIDSNFLVGGYFICVAAAFYFFKFALGFEIEALRDKGWVFDPPAAGNPWYHFYTLYDFGAVNWAALAQTIPAMFALTFFGVLHVPINVPALGISTGEDNLNVDRELAAHGVSNAVSGLLGSIQNYLVYTNSLLFIDSGGNHRLAGIILAAATFGILIVGPVLIGYIPIMVVGALIFLLGIELMEEALVHTWGKLHRLEYLTIIIIVVTMGAWDFVVGILIGIVLACLNYVLQTSRKPAIKATYSGEIASSTVSRHPIQSKFLHEAGQQTRIFKLAGFLFFGTIVSVENQIRALLDDKAFQERPIRFLIIDFANINGIDFSAAEAFTRIKRVLGTRYVKLVMSGLNIDGENGKSLRNVGLFDEGEVEIFKTLNEALEFCENNLLKAFYRRQELLQRHGLVQTAATLDIPQAPTSHRSEFASSFPTEPTFSSPRYRHLQRVASQTLTESNDSATNPSQLHYRYSTYNQPLPLLLQLFEPLSAKDIDFWYPLKDYFLPRTYPPHTTLYHTGDPAAHFFLVESGFLRAEYDHPQGRYSEVIVAGRPCGEMPFFSRTERTAKVNTEEKEVKVWMMGWERWQGLRKEWPDVAMEMLEVVVKLNKERMDAVTRYILTSG